MSDTRREQAVERAKTLLQNSSTSVASMLAHADGWLSMAAPPRETGFRVADTEAGALGALVNAWGRLTFLARANGTYDRVRDDLDQAADRLVETHHLLMSPCPGDDERMLLLETAACLRDVYQVVEQQNTGPALAEVCA
jgi:hypothetical protein